MCYYKNKFINSASTYLDFNILLNSIFISVAIIDLQAIFFIIIFIINIS